MTARDALPCSIGGRRYLVDVENVSWGTVRPTRQGVDQEAGAGEASLSNEVVWRRVRDNWVGGAGQEYADLPDDEDKSSDVRFSSSVDVDPFERRSLRLAAPQRVLMHVPREVGGAVLSGATGLDELGDSDFYFSQKLPAGPFYKEATPVTFVENAAFKLDVWDIVGDGTTRARFTWKATGATVTTNLMLVDPWSSVETLALVLEQSGPNISVQLFWAGDSVSTTIVGTLNVAGGNLTLRDASHEIYLAVGPVVSPTSLIRLYPWAGGAWLASNTVGTVAAMTGTSSGTGFAGLVFTASTAVTLPDVVRIAPYLSTFDSVFSPTELTFASLLVVAGRIVVFASVDLATGTVTGLDEVGTNIGFLGSPATHLAASGADQAWVRCENTNAYTISGTELTAAPASLDGIGLAGGRLLGWVDAALSELASDGTPTVVVTHPVPTFRWAGVVGGPSGVYAYGSSGPFGEVHYLPVSDVDGSLESSLVAAPLPPGEWATAMLFHLGVMVLGTNLGLRLAAVNADNTLSYGPLLEFGQVSMITALGDDLWAVADGTVYRVDPALFTDTLQPAWATAGSESDLPALPSHATGAILQAATTIADPTRATAVAVASPAAVLAYVPGVAPFCASGSIDLGWFTYGIGEILSLDSITVEVEAVAPGSTATVTVHVDTPSTNSVLTGVLDATTATTLTLTADTDVRARRFRVRLELAGDTVDEVSPEVREVVLRAAPTPFLSDEMILPVWLTEQVVDDTGQTSGLNPWDEWSFLRGLRDSRQRVPLILGAFTATVRVEDVGVRSGGLGGGNGLDGWSEDGRWMKGRWEVRLVTVET